MSTVFIQSLNRKLNLEVPARKWFVRSAKRDCLFLCLQRATGESLWLESWKILSPRKRRLVENAAPNEVAQLAHTRRRRDLLLNL